MEKRVQEASALREFFHEQWRYLREALLAHNESEVSHQRQISDAIEDIVENMDPRIRGVSNYKKQLRGSAGALIQYVQDIVAGVPSAITISKQSYVREPLINAAFSSNAALKKLVRESDEIKKFAENHMQTSDFGLYVPEFYALLWVIREEQQIFGSELNNGVLQRDVPQTVVNFYGHQLVAPSLSEQDVRSSLKKILFDSTIVTLRSNMVKLRHSQSYEDELKAALHPELNINNPEVYLKLLSEQLCTPENIINAKTNMIRINKMGIKRSVDADDLTNEFSLNEVTIGSSHYKSVSLVRIQYSELNL